jgi:hypothetical protein
MHLGDRSIHDGSHSHGLKRSRAQKPITEGKPISEESWEQVHRGTKDYLIDLDKRRSRRHRRRRLYRTNAHLPEESVPPPAKVPREGLDAAAAGRTNAHTMEEENAKIQSSGKRPWKKHGKDRYIIPISSKESRVE